MDAQSREKFWNTLCALDGVDVKQDAQKLSDVIQYPKYLYRFRPVSFSSLDGLQSNKLFFSSADHYDDPFDSFLHIDIPEVENEVRKIFEAKSSWGPRIEEFSKLFGISKDKLYDFFSSLDMEQTKKMTLEIFQQIPNIVQSEMQSICFSEDGFNEQLWLKYAENHNGFVLEYDLTDNAAFLCGKQNICEQCHTSEYFPNPIQDMIMSGAPASLWERERIALIKKICHEHDQEWRMIFPGPSGGRPYICWRPSSVTVGIKMSQVKKNLVFTLAKVAGIPHIYECYTENGELKRKMLG